MTTMKAGRTTDLRTARVEAGVTRKAPAEALGRSQYAIDRVELGDVEPIDADVQAWHAAIKKAAAAPKPEATPKTAKAPVKKTTAPKKVAAKKAAPKATQDVIKTEATKRKAEKEAAA